MPGVEQAEFLRTTWAFCPHLCISIPFAQAGRGFNLRMMCAETVRKHENQEHQLVLLGVESADEYASWIKDERSVLWA